MTAGESPSSSPAICTAAPTRKGARKSTAALDGKRVPCFANRHWIQNLETSEPERTARGRDLNPTERRGIPEIRDPNRASPATGAARIAGATAAAGTEPGNGNGSSPPGKGAPGLPETGRVAGNGERVEVVGIGNRVRGEIRRLGSKSMWDGMSFSVSASGFFVT